MSKARGYKVLLSKGRLLALPANFIKDSIVLLGTNATAYLSVTPMKTVVEYKFDMRLVYTFLAIFNLTQCYKTLIIVGYNFN